MAGSVVSEAVVPERLVAFDQWVCWRAEERDGAVTKVPVDPAGGGFASTTDPGSWAVFETARERVEGGGVDGVGFVFTEADPIVGVDLDDCRDPETGRPASWAKDVIERLDSYTEVSPSGTGYHVLVAGSLPGDRNRKGEVEVYETARFFTVTADHVDGTPRKIKERAAALADVYEGYLAPDASEESPATRGGAGGRSGRGLDDAVLLEKAKNAANGEKFERLYQGDTGGYESQSEADMALCSLLAFWTGGDSGQMDRLFRESGLMRTKWDERHFADGSTYGEKTIERAITGTSEFYDPGGGATGISTQSADVESEARDGSSRERARVERIAELEQRLSEVLEEKAELEAELEAERSRRKSVEAELEADGDGDGSLFSWL